MTLTIDQDQIAQVARTVWASFPGASLREPETSDTSATDSGYSATATVHISGSWNGSVIISCSATLARRAAAAMFQIGTDDLNDQEITDAFGELANMIGGSLKSLLPEPSQLSLPTVSHGATHVVTVPGARLVQQVELACDGDRLHISVWCGHVDAQRFHHVELEGMTR